jgi:hypothetical protein
MRGHPGPSVREDLPPLMSAARRGDESRGGMKPRDRRFGSPGSQQPGAHAMSESARRTRGQRVVRALGFVLLGLLVAGPDYWTYHVLSSDNVVAGLPILILSYIAFALALWLLCAVVHAVRLRRPREPANPRRCEPRSSRPHRVPDLHASGAAPAPSAHVPAGDALTCQRRCSSQTRQRGLSSARRRGRPRRSCGSD